MRVNTKNRYNNRKRVSKIQPCGVYLIFYRNLMIGELIQKTNLLTCKFWTMNVLLVSQLNKGLNTLPPSTLPKIPNCSKPFSFQFSPVFFFSFRPRGYHLMAAFIKQLGSRNPLWWWWWW